MHVFSDHFSRVATGYAEYRPNYPPQLFDALVEITNESIARTDETAVVAALPVDTSTAPGKRPHLVWDCAAGTGQATIALRERFGRVFASDASANQIRQAGTHPHVHYAVATAEHCPLRSGTVSLVTVAQALHWFNVNAFFDEAKRVLAPNGIIAVWCYGLLRVDENAKVERAIFEFAEVTVGRWWPKERKHVDAEYRDLPFPFERVTLPAFDMTAAWTRAQLLGYLRTWSAVSRKREAEHVDPVLAFEEVLAAAWGDAPTLKLRWPLTVLVGRSISK